MVAYLNLGIFKLKKRTIKRLLIGFFAVRLVLHLVRSFSDVSMPHVWRQIDTLGVSLRYYLRWTTETFSLESLLPAVLQSGDANGIMPMELPILNLLFAPFWALGTYWGKITIYFTLAGVTYLFIFSIYGRDIKKHRQWASSLLLLPTVSYGAEYLEKFMPDFWAMALVLNGCILLLRSKMAWLWIALGLLMKPTAVVTIGLAPFINSEIRKSNLRKKFWPLAVQIGVPLTVTIAYYKFGTQYIDSFRTGDTALFAVALRNPLSSLLEILGNPAFIWSQLSNRVFFPYVSFFCFIGIGLIRNKTIRRQCLWLCCLLVSQFLTIAALDGGHMAIHDYYCMGLAPSAVLIFYYVLKFSKPIVSGFLLLALGAHCIELGVQYIQPKRFVQYSDKHHECSSIKASHPTLPWGQGFVFRSPIEPYPTTGLCFGERQNSLSAKYGVFPIGAEVPVDCSIIDQRKYYRLVVCGD